MDVDLVALRELHDTVNWGKHIAVRPYISSSASMESWSQAKPNGLAAAVDGRVGTCEN